MSAKARDPTLYAGGSALRRTLCLIALALAAPGAARAEATIVSRDVPLRGERALAAAAPTRFDLVGLHWQGPGTVRFRTRSPAGRWSPWRLAAAADEDLPDAGAGESRRGAWRLGDPWWTGPSDRIEYRLIGRVTRLRAWFVSSPVVKVPLRRTAVAGSPPVISRAAWGADESLRRGQPAYAAQLRFAVVHHTAGANDYTRAESPAIVRAIMLYHVKGNGWDDIGYNFLVDRYGQVFEGRYGGVDRNVVGAHTRGFNTGSVGVAVLGSFGAAPPPRAAEDALGRLLAWRLDVAHVDPLSMPSVISGGNGRFPAGLPVLLRAVSAHRDADFTEDPGDAFYPRIGQIAAAAARTGLPKLYAPLVDGAVGGPVRFRAQLSGALQWTVTVRDALGEVVAQGAGAGQAVDWTWDATAAPTGAYTWAIEAGPAVLPATGTLGAAGSVAIAELAADPETVTPNADGYADESTITYRLTAPATVTIQVLDSVGGPLTVLERARKGAGEHAFTFSPLDFPDGAYQVAVTARGTAGREVSKSVQVLVTRTLGAPEVAPARFSPNADGRRDRVAFRFALAGDAQVRVRVLRDGKWVATPFKGPLGAGAHEVVWDGAKRIGRLLDGEYEAVVEATDAVGTAAVSLPFFSDTRAPTLRFLPGLPVRLAVDEPATLTLLVGGRPARRILDAAGTFTIAPRGRVRAVAWDAAGNKSVPARR